MPQTGRDEHSLLEQGGHSRRGLNLPLQQQVPNEEIRQQKEPAL
ncbi:hypothetical protein VXQ11_15020 [Acinetobacter sp. 197]